jgi:SAM-dependent methyltransferase
LFLHPRPDRSELSRIYPDNYHAYEFTSEAFGLSYTFRRRLETRRMLQWCSRVPSGGSIVDIGAGDGFHLGVLRDFGDPSWRLVAVEPDARAAAMAAAGGLAVHSGFLEDLDLESEQFDFAILIMVIEHVDDPIGMLREVRRILKPGGAVGIVTDNIGSVDAHLGRASHWGGYHFPRHFNLYSRRSLSLLAHESGLGVERITTMMSPVNWVYTAHNTLADRGASEGVLRWLSLKSPLALAAFTALDAVCNAVGNGALLRAILRKE